MDRQIATKALRHGIAAFAVAVVIGGAVTPEAEARKGPPGFFGVAANVDRPSNEEIDRMGVGGVGVLRVTFNWSTIEPKRPKGSAPAFNFTHVDRVVARAAYNGVRVLPILYGTPRWLAKRPQTAPISSKRLRSEWGRFVRALAQRYGANGTFWQQYLPVFPDSKVRAITHWQIWNEPTTRQFWRGPSGSQNQIPAEYAQLLKQTSKALRGTDPRARIVTAGVFGTPHLGKGLRSSRFFRSLFLTKGIGKHFDAVGVHPYAPSWPGLRIQLGWASRELSRAGLRKKVWITEIGWPTKGEKGDFQLYLKRTPKQQAATLRKTFNKLVKQRKRYRLGKVIWFTFRDNPNLGKEFERCNLCKYAGLFSASMKPRRSWTAFTKFTGGRTG